MDSAEMSVARARGFAIHPEDPLVASTIDRLLGARRIVDDVPAMPGVTEAVAVADETAGAEQPTGTATTTMLASRTARAMPLSARSITPNATAFCNCCGSRPQPTISLHAPAVRSARASEPPISPTPIIHRRWIGVSVTTRHLAQGRNHAQVFFRPPHGNA